MREKNVTRDEFKQDITALFNKMQQKFRDREYFTLSNITHDKMGGFKHTKDLKEVIKDFIEKGLIENTEAGRYRFTSESDKDAEEFDEDEFIDSYRSSLEEEIKNYKRFIVTTAVMGKEANKPFLKSLKNYAERNKALILLLPCEDVVSRGKKASPIELSDDLKEFKVIFKDTYLNRNLCLCALKTSAKQINPLSGLDRLPVAKDASIIVASPKVFLKYIPNMHYDIPPALMTTGAVTINNYDTEKYMSKRTSYLAEADHTYGAVIVEIENEHIFHFRHIQASKDNTVTDLGIEYLPDGSIRRLKNTVMVMGDSHTGYHDIELHEEVMWLAKETNVDKVILHDVFNGTSISHHDVGKHITRARKAEEFKLGLENECKAVKNYIKDIEERGMEVIIPEANHNKALLRYLEEGRYVDDPMNHKFSLKLAAKAVDGVNPLQYAIESLLDYKKDSVHWLEVDESCKYYGVELGLHGDLGASGARPSQNTFNKGIGNCVTAHTHSASIMRETYCVGTVGLADMGYNKGLSAWTHTCCLVYSNGTKQLVNFIPNEKGDYSFQL